MARSDLIISLVKASVRGDVADARAVAEAIAADERSKKHSTIADRISYMLDTVQPAQRNDSTGVPSIRVRDGSGGIQRSEPRRPLSALYLDESVRAACDELIQEQRRADVLRAHGLEPRHRLLLAGPPGNGKTSLAEVIAYELALPLFTVRYDAVVTSYLGETAQRLRRVFDFARTEPCVLFFDEFDAIGKERGDLHETGEIKRVITTLLLQIDDLPPYCVLIGATNHPELLDRAAWRRFELRLNLGSPSSKQMIKYFNDQLDTLGGQPGYTAKRLYESVDPVSFSEAEAFFIDVRRRIALEQGARELRTILDDRVKAFRSHSRAKVRGDIDSGTTDSSISQSS